MTTAGPPVFERPAPRCLADGSLERHEVVSPGMCGPTALFAGRVGDWTWDAVSAACGVDAYRATDPTGAPTYLSFAYFRIRSDGLGPEELTFGDRLLVRSRVHGTGSESALTVHRLRRDAACGDDGAGAGAMHVETFNRWVVRTRPGENRDLASAAPVGFRHEHLPPAPSGRGVRHAIASARADGRLPEDDDAGRTPVVRGLRLAYRVDASRDLNGVGLLYFASYFAIVDWALLHLWRHLGRPSTLFARRALLEQRLVYLANTDGDSVVDVELTAEHSAHEPADERVAMTLHDRADGRRLAVCALRVRVPGEAR